MPDIYFTKVGVGKALIYIYYFSIENFINMPFTPETWGRMFWIVIHIVAFYCDTIFDKDNNSYKNFKTFIHSISNVLPCNMCAQHFKKYIDDNPIPITSNGADNPTYLKWTVSAHNNVRNMQGKVMPSLDDVVKSYQNGEVFSMSKANNILLNNNNNNNTNNNSNNNTWKLAFTITTPILIVILLILIIIIVGKKYKKV